MKKVAAIIICCFVILGPISPLYAKFLDDWITQKVETSADYLEGQKRGYFTGGSFSARWPAKSDYLVSFDQPRLKFGCGGIDAFLGGFSFLNFEYLVQKLQRIMTAAPAAAFDMALNTLCQPCANTIKSLEAIADSLNGLQLNDCRAGKVVAARMLNTVTDNAKIRQEAEKDFLLTGGLEDLPQKIKEIWTSKNNAPSKTVKELISGCPAEIQKYAIVGQSLMDTVLQDLGYDRNMLVGLVRGVYGDQEYVSDAQGWRHVNKCFQNDQFSLNKLFNGEVYQKPVGSGTCSLITGQKANLYTWAEGLVRSIYQKMKSKAELTAEESNFIKHLPAPAYAILKAVIVTGQEGASLNQLAQMAARGYAYMAFTDMANQSYNASVKITDIVAKKGQETHNCKTSMLDPIVDFIKEKQNEIAEYAKGLRDIYIRSLQEDNLFSDISNRYERFDKIAQTKLAGMVSPALAQKMLESNK